MANLNTFRFEDAKGIVVTAKNTRDCKAAEALVAGDIVKIKDVASPITVVEKITAATDPIFGVVVYDAARKNGCAAAVFPRTHARACGKGFVCQPGAGIQNRKESTLSIKRVSKLVISTLPFD